jgi:hypothetical protein
MPSGVLKPIIAGAGSAIAFTFFLCSALKQKAAIMLCFGALNV